MMSSHRLNSPLQMQRANLKELQRKKFLFLSLEGTVTEKQYFNHLQYKIQKESYNIVIQIEIIDHNKKDGKSSLNDVLRRLEDCSKSKATNTEEDYFAIIVDRDRGCHSEQGLRNVLNHCKKNGYKFYLTNPCFEFWLLMHVCCIREQYENLDLFLKNEKISSKHTYTSKELSNIMSHSKTISSRVFDDKYFPNIPKAVMQAKTFAKSPEELFTNIGSNLYNLMELIGISNKQEENVLDGSNPDC